jgi:hypothetical protein
LKPSIGVNAGDTVKQGAIAAALGAVVTPIAAVLAFVDPGLAKDQNCAQLLADAEKKGPPPPKSAVTPDKSAEGAKSRAAVVPDSNSKLR